MVGAPFDDGAAGLIKARPMSSCAAVKSGASSRSWRPSDAAAHDLFGKSVAISGETVVVGASTDEAQQVEIKARPMTLCAAVESGASSRSWRPRTPRLDDLFGDSVAISGETVVVGAPSRCAAGFSRLGLCLCAQR